MTVTQVVVLTDQNIELICGQLRGMLQKHQIQIEADMLADRRKSVEIPMELHISSLENSGSSSLEITYRQLIRKDRSRIMLEDFRQEPLFPRE